MNNAPGEELRAQLALHRAKEAARAGDLEEAGRVLDAAPAAPGVLDLRARVHAQRGEWDAADRCWAQVQESNPSDVDAREGRRVIGEIRAGRRRARPVLTAGRTAAAVSVLACVALAGGGWVAAGADDQPRPDPGQAQLQAEALRAQQLQQRLADLDADRAAAADRRARALDAIAGRLAMPGVSVRRRADDVHVVFDAGLFTSGTAMTRQGAELLTALGKQLADLPADTTVVGHAVAVPGGPASGGSSVALSRAQVAAERLAAGSGLPLTAFALTSADQADAPFPDAARNRTVTLSVNVH